jgi:microcystin-dependent protein
MKKLTRHITLFFLLCAAVTAASAQTSIGIGTTTPDPNAVLDVHSNQKGVLFPRLTTVQQTNLGNLLGPSEMGMIVIDATTGKQKSWSGTVWTTIAASNPMTAAAPLTVATNNIQLNPGTAVGDLLTWNGTIWVNIQPAVQHFTYSFDNHQPYLALNYIIGITGIFPSQNSAATPYLGEIYLMASNFAPQGFALCNGQILSINQNAALFALLGTTYGGNGTTTFALPDLRSRVPVHIGSASGLSSYILGQVGGSETQTFTH